MIRSVSFIFAFQLVSILTFSGSALSQSIDYSRHVQSVVVFQFLRYAGGRNRTGTELSLQRILSALACESGPSKCFIYNVSLSARRVFAQHLHELQLRL